MRIEKKQFQTDFVPFFRKIQNIYHHFMTNKLLLLNFTEKKTILSHFSQIKIISC